MQSSKTRFEVNQSCSGADRASSGAWQTGFETGQCEPAVDGSTEQCIAMECSREEDVNQFLVGGTDLLNQSDEIVKPDETEITDWSSQQETSIPQTPDMFQYESPSSSLHSQTAAISSQESEVLSNEDLFHPFSPDTLSLPKQLLVKSTEDVEHPIRLQLSIDEDVAADSEQNLSVMFNSSVCQSKEEGGAREEEEGERGGGEDTMEWNPDFNIPCGQPPSSHEGPKSSAFKNGCHADRKARFALDAFGFSGPSSCPAKPIERERESDVQLEYDMPEITLSQFEASQGSIAEILGTPSKMAAIARDPVSLEGFCSQGNVESQVLSAQVEENGDRVEEEEEGWEGKVGDEGGGGGGGERKRHEVREYIKPRRLFRKLERAGERDEKQEEEREEKAEERETEGAEEEEEEVEGEEEEKEVESPWTQSSLRLSLSQRRMVEKRLCAEEAESQSSDGERGEDNDKEDEEEDSIWLTPQVWDGIEDGTPSLVVDCQRRSCDVSHDKSHGSSRDELQDIGSLCVTKDHISQLDGTVEETKRGVYVRTCVFFLPFPPILPHSLPFFTH